MRLLLAAAVLSAGSAFGQTPPVIPQTPDVKVPPPITIAPPKEITIGREPLSAAEAVRIALANQPQVGIARADVTTARGRTQQTQSALFPQFSAGATFSQQETIRGGSSGPTGGGGQNRFSTNVNVDQLLFDFGRTRDQVRQQSALERAVRQALVRTEQTVALQVKQAFYNYTENLALVRFSEQNVANRQRQLDQATARVEAGLGAPADIVRAKTGLADAVLSLSNARNAALNSQVELAQAMGIDPRTPITPAETAEPTVDSEGELQRLVEQAIANRPDIREAQERVSAARYAVSAAQKSNLPRVSATAGLGGRGADDPLQSQTANFGISVNWTFGDGGLTAGRVREARGNEEAARQQLIAVTQQAVTDVSQAWADLQIAQQRVDTAQVQVANATELLRISEGRYQGGIGDFLEVTDAQNSLFSAQRNLTQAQQDVQRARARLRTAIGLS